MLKIPAFGKPRNVMRHTINPFKTMKRIIKTLFLFLSLICFCSAKSQTTKDIVKRIAKINIVEVEGANISKENENYTNFRILRERATTPELVELLEHQNSVVNVYSSYSLIDRSYDEIPRIYKKFLENDKFVETQKGCNGGQDKVSSEIYHHYWNSVSYEARETDKVLNVLDSITLYSENSDWLLILRALENRVYPKSYNKQIEFLAFEKNNRDAIFYLLNWYKAEYRNQLENALLTYLEQTKFEDVGVTQYYDTIEEIFKFRNEVNKEKIVVKLKNDEFWKIHKSLFIGLLQKNGIYENMD